MTSRHISNCEAANEAILVRSPSFQLSIDRQSKHPDIPPHIVVRTRDGAIMSHLEFENSGEFAEELVRLLWVLRVEAIRKGDNIVFHAPTILQFAADRCLNGDIRLMLLTRDGVSNDFCLSEEDSAALRNQLHHAERGLRRGGIKTTRK